MPLSCGDNGNTTPNDISVWLQTPVYFPLAFAEILGFTTLTEYCYSEAPKNMRTNGHVSIYRVGVGSGCLCCGVLDGV